MLTPVQKKNILNILDEAAKWPEDWEIVPREDAQFMCYPKLSSPVIEVRVFSDKPIIPATHLMIDGVSMGSLASLGTLFEAKLTDIHNCLIYKQKTSEVDRALASAASKMKITLES